MADNRTAEGVNTAVPAPEHGDHDRVVMLSLNPDGTPRQLKPELIGDPEVALAATKRQFVEQAVSAADSELRRKLTATDEGVGDDPTVRKLREAHEAAADAAEKAAERVVKSLHRDA